MSLYKLSSAFDKHQKKSPKTQNKILSTKQDNVSITFFDFW